MIVVYAPDLMDQSRIRAVLSGARFVRSPALLLGEVDAELVIVDLDRPGVGDVLAALVEGGRTVVGFGAHVDGERLTAASELGVDAMARSRFFGRWLASPPDG